MSKIELPPLPEPLVHTDARINGEWKKWALYDKPQLRARDRQIVELCAQAVLEAGPKEGPLRLVSEGFAAAIRSLLDPAEKETSHGA
jgi:hypothetical protein